MHLDGVFVGACTTTEEELVLAALVRQVGLQKKVPFAKGKKYYIAGSLPVVEKLRELGLLEVYEAAGFTRGPPGCSYCVGLSAKKAGEGETWLNSQNRNFKNRMGKGRPSIQRTTAGEAILKHVMTNDNRKALLET
jgi:homoaconitase/3-isopropylmalate dehydratase large subunit